MPEILFYLSSENPQDFYQDEGGQLPSTGEWGVVGQGEELGSQLSSLSLI